jgi:hypothetical protein
MLHGLEVMALNVGQDPEILMDPAKQRIVSDRKPECIVERSASFLEVAELHAKATHRIHGFTSKDSITQRNSFIVAALAELLGDRRLVATMVYHRLPAEGFNQHRTVPVQLGELDGLAVSSQGLIESPGAIVRTSGTEYCPGRAWLGIAMVGGESDRPANHRDLTTVVPSIAADVRPSLESSTEVV